MDNQMRLGLDSITCIKPNYILLKHTTLLIGDGCLGIIRVAMLASSAYLVSAAWDKLLIDQDRLEVWKSPHSATYSKGTTRNDNIPTRRRLAVYCSHDIMLAGSEQRGCHGSNRLAQPRRSTPMDATTVTPAPVWRRMDHGGYHGLVCNQSR